MTVSVSFDGDDTTFTFEITALSTKADPLIEEAAHYFWEQGYGVLDTDFDEATNQQKLQAMNKALKQFLLDAANTQEVTDDVDAARTAATVHDLDGVS